jgi:hypothetical protein
MTSDIDDSQKSKRNKTPKIPLYDESLAKAVAEGNQLLALEEKQKPVQKPAPSETSTNPYIRARNQILAAMGEYRRTLLMKMETGVFEKDRVYDDFVSEVVKLGDQFSN